MATNQEQLIASFVARHGVTLCPSTKKQARSLRALRRDDEAKATEEAAGAERNFFNTADGLPAMSIEEARAQALGYGQ